MFSLPGHTRITNGTPRTSRSVPLPRATSLTPRPLPAPALPMTVRIICPDNGAGLSRDREYLAASFEKAGWTVTLADPRDRRPCDNCAVNVHVEIFAPHFVAAALRNVVIPNPEWWDLSWTPHLRRDSFEVWCKTADARRIFSELGAKTRHIGFVSADRKLDGSHKQRVFLHLAGNSPNKGGDLLLKFWRPEWPRLIFVAATTGSRANSPAPNITLVSARLSDEEVRRIQNECAFHIYPSRYEGFGHAPWEGLSCGAVVFTTDGPPFTEHVEAFHRIESVSTGPEGLIIGHEPTEDGLARAVDWAQCLSDAELAEESARSREAWLRNAQAATIDRHIAVLAEGEPLTDAPPIMVSAAANRPLASLPPLLYVGRVNCVTGQGTAARHQIHTLRHHGLRLQIADAGSCGSPDPQGCDAFVQSARASDPGITPRGTIYHAQPNTARTLRSESHPRPHILVSVWETTRLPVDWVRWINSYDQVWCATHWQRDVYRASGVKEGLLRVVPFAIDPALFPVASQRPRSSHTTFGSVFQWSERKNTAALIGAYLHAFSADDAVTLVLKSYEGDSPQSDVSARVAAIVGSFHLAKRAPRIQVVTEASDSAAMKAFYQSLGCYVSTHRGEGFGFPIAEALLWGVPVIATNWSAPAEFAAGCFRGVGYTLEPARNMDWQPFYDAGQLWAHIDVQNLAQAMREAHGGKLQNSAADFRKRCEALMRRAGESAASALGDLFR